MTSSISAMAASANTAPIALCQTGAAVSVGTVGRPLSDLSSVESARQAGHAAAARAEQRANDACPGFSERAYAWLETFARGMGTSQVSGESLVLAMKADGIVPTDDRAFGGTFSRAIRHNVLRVAGYVARTRGHGSAGGKLYARGGV